MRIEVSLILITLIGFTHTSWAGNPCAKYNQTCVPADLKKVASIEWEPIGIKVNFSRIQPLSINGKYTCQDCGYSSSSGIRIGYLGYFGGGSSPRDTTHKASGNLEAHWGFVWNQEWQLESKNSKLKLKSSQWVTDSKVPGNINYEYSTWQSDTNFKSLSITTHQIKHKRKRSESGTLNPIQEKVGKIKNLKVLDLLDIEKYQYSSKSSSTKNVKVGTGYLADKHHGSSDPRRDSENDISTSMPTRMSGVKKLEQDGDDVEDFFSEEFNIFKKKSMTIQEVWMNLEETRLYLVASNGESLEFTSRSSGILSGVSSDGVSYSGEGSYNGSLQSQVKNLTNYLKFIEDNLRDEIFEQTFSMYKTPLFRLSNLINTPGITHLHTGVSRDFSIIHFAATQIFQFELDEVRNTPFFKRVQIVDKFIQQIKVINSQNFRFGTAGTTSSLIPMVAKSIRRELEVLLNTAENISWRDSSFLDYLKRLYELSEEAEIKEAYGDADIEVEWLADSILDQAENLNRYSSSLVLLDKDESIEKLKQGFGFLLQIRQ